MRLGIVGHGVIGTVNRLKLEFCCKASGGLSGARSFSFKRTSTKGTRKTPRLHEIQQYRGGSRLVRSDH